ncbi:sensor histidine kinase [Pedobacter sp. SYP-B3415]|uniref:sensor histidine kinase n=1 Tax=Pedobacter sp. SYP-B3415 TaxID=2496641 RepID=UPI00101D15C8|nr:sensor histidine kinase [Pedobacter sp. SYP-B3415]
MKNKAQIIVHSIYWGIIAFVFTLAFIYKPGRSSFNEIMVTYVYFTVINVSIFYLNYTLLIPQLIKLRRKYWWYIASILFVILIMGLLKSVIAVLNPDEILRFRESVQIDSQTKKRIIKYGYHSITNYAVGTIFSSGFFIVSSCLIKFTIDWFANERIQRNLETEKKEMELQFLKSQLNPHFLFNSLNNIYSLAYQKSDRTADAIMKLSEIMRYMIYESNDSSVALSKEVDYLKSYIELQKLRFKDKAFVELNLNGEIDGQKIVPLILISFVENAFKHGVANDPSDPIRINLIANQRILHFSITNRKSAANKDRMGGVGLNNVERRLQLLYPERYKLNIVNSETHYTSELMLDI